VDVLVANVGGPPPGPFEKKTPSGARATLRFRLGSPASHLGKSMRNAAWSGGGVTVLSNTWIALLKPSTTQISFSSGVSPTPWLGQPWRFTGPCL
jgi:hypothetical protein